MTSSTSNVDAAVCVRWDTSSGQGFCLGEAKTRDMREMLFCRVAPETTGATTGKCPIARGRDTILYNVYAHHTPAGGQCTIHDRSLSRPFTLHRRYGTSTIHHAGNIDVRRLQSLHPIYSQCGLGTTTYCTYVFEKDRRFR